MNNKFLFASVIFAAMVRGDSQPIAAEGQSSHLHQHPTTSESGAVSRHTAAPLPISVDGKVTPERIPDDLAYIHFISSVSIKSDALASEIGRRRAILRTAGLADHDAQAIIATLNGVREQLTEIDSQRKQITPAAATTLPGQIHARSLQLRRQDIMTAARQRVLAALSADGIRILHDHIQRRVKSRIVIYGDARP